MIYSFHIKRMDGKEWQACIPKSSSESLNQAILLVITNGKKSHYLAVKTLFKLLQGITSNHDGDHYCMNCLYSFATESKLTSNENACKDYDYCDMVMSEVGKNILKCNQEKNP